MTEENPSRPDPKQPGRNEEPKDHVAAGPNVAAENQSEDDLPGQEFSGQDLGDFFQRFPGTFRWPKPDAQAVAAAVEAIQRLSGTVVAPETADAHEAAGACSGCGRSLTAGARFCVWCGIPIEPMSGDAADVSQHTAGQHHFHHHYHHFVSGPGTSVAPGTESGTSAPRGRAPSPAGAGSPGNTAGGTMPGGRAEAGARQIVQDWAQACNTKHIDDLIELYSADATLIRSSVPPVRSLPAIREFLVSLLEAGLGDVEMESLRVEMMGEVAIDLGRCKMLVPIAMGKRREERGKYLIVLVRQPNGTWKILADCWATDLAPTVSAHELPARKAGEPIPPVRKPR